MASTPRPEAPTVRRRDLQKEQTRLDLALAAFELARTNGLASVRIPQVAAAAGVSPRTFNNYFPSKEAAIVWPSTLRTGRLVASLAGRPPAEPIGDALIAAVAALYSDTGMDGLPDAWLGQFRRLVAAEPTLVGEYLKANAAAERGLAEVIAARTGSDAGELEPQVVAAVVAGAERAAVLFWARPEHASASLVDVVRNAVSMAVRGLTGPGSIVT
ncbi:MAG: TetR family transcriptional regulator [Candidatus Dormibacteria bacterium]|jgi:AcrR family transcriptional regulator